MFNWIPNVVDRLLKEYLNVDLRMQRIIRWFARAIVALIGALVFFVLMLGIHKIKTPKEIIVSQTKYIDTCINNQDISNGGIDTLKNHEIQKKQTAIQNGNDNVQNNEFN